ncbi:Stk1 family PASTA domain-containing Ser/Thr kinase [Aeromicrobium sp.]|uniref:Stk1 family PASTA domain-containing Ser/Thr kinase n=1 Tax=Aeromicrobium sp. TaxID=1871063 RepID=UPI003D6C6290
MGDDALVGRVLDGRYLVGERIARGGMASVFMATDQRLGRTVAVKVMHHGLGDDRTFTQRFEREAQAAAQLNHRNVVSVFDQGTDGEITYLVMEYVPGRTLRDVMRDEAPMKPTRALELLSQVLVALSAAHAAHLIHRDIKPENVLITPDGDVKVADFGLARAVSSATTATGGTLIGTISYLAPEIVVNEGADARSDVYACGAVLYEMLTGEKPHSGESPIQVAYKHVHEDIGAPSKERPELPPYLDALVARATCRDRDQRSTDARVLLQQVRLVQRALEEGLEDDPDLTADLMPTPVHHHPAGVEEDTEQVRVPAGALAAGSMLAGTSAATAAVVGAGANGAEAPTEVVDRAGTGGPPEHTVQWGDDADQEPPKRGLHPPMSVEQYRESRQDEERSRRGRFMLIGVIVATVLAVALGWYVGIGRYVDAPMLVNRTETQAKQEAADAGFTFSVVGRKYSETAPLGTVISTDPAGGDRILPGSTIDGIVSKGKERYAIPDLKNRTLDEAERALEKLNLKVGDVSTAYNETIDKGDVIRAADFDVGAEVKRGTAVDLLVSKGRKPIDIVDYTGEPESEATSGLENAGFEVEVDREYSDDVDKGLVISQSPDDGKGFKDDTITLEVSRGPETVDVPNVVGQSRNDAEETLEDAGFDTRAFGNGNFTVVAQRPGSDDKAKPGSTVTILGF